MSQEPYALEFAVIPSPGTDIPDVQIMAQKIQVLQPFAQVIHIDFLDGIFAKTKTSLDFSQFTPFTKDTLFEAHLMVADPLRYIDDLARAGFKRFVGQIEMMPDVSAFIAKGQDVGEVGVAVDKDTAIETIFPFLEDIDFALVMTVKAGLSRQSFLPEMLEKVKKLKGKANFLPIEIDGGMNDKTIMQAKDAGATRFVTTGYVLDSDSPKAQFARLQQVLQQE